MNQIILQPLQADDKEQFILDNQEAFKYGATEEFGMRDNHFEEDGEIISRTTIENAIKNGEGYRILCNGEIAGGAVVRVDGDKGDLELLFVLPECHGKRMGGFKSASHHCPQLKTCPHHSKSFQGHLCRKRQPIKGTAKQNHIIIKKGRRTLRSIRQQQILSAEILPHAHHLFSGVLCLFSAGISPFPDAAFAFAFVFFESFFGALTVWISHDRADIETALCKVPALFCLERNR